MKVWTPDELATVMGTGEKRCMPSEQANRVVMRKSVTALVDIARGTRLTLSLVGTRRPCPEGALSPASLVSVLGQYARRDVAAGESFFPDMLGRTYDVAME